MWDLAVIGTDTTAPVDASLTVADLLDDAYRDAHVILVTTAGGAQQAERLAATIEDAGTRADVVALTPTGAINDPAVRRALVALLDEVGSPVIVEGLCSPQFALVVELLVGALRPAPVRRLILTVAGEHTSYVDGGSAIAVRVETEAEFLAALGAVDDLLVAGEPGPAGGLLAAVSELADEASDPVATTLPTIVSTLELAAACRTVPAPGSARILLAAALQQALGTAVQAFVDALLDEEGRDGAGALAFHALNAATRTGDETRAATLARIVSTWAGVVTQPIESLTARAREALSDAQLDLITPERDMASVLIAHARELLQETEIGQDLGWSSHTLLIDGAQGAPVVERFVEDSGPWDDVLVLGPVERDELSGVPVRGLATSLPAPDQVRAALGVEILAGDRVALVGRTATGDLERLATQACLALRARLTVLGTRPHPDVMRATVIDETIVPARRAALAQLLARRAVDHDAWPALAALAARLPDACDPLTLALAGRLTAGSGTAADIRRLDRAGVDEDVVTAARERFALEPRLRRVLGAWPRVRQGLIEERGGAAGELGHLVPELLGPGLLASAADNVADATVIDVAAALGVSDPGACVQNELIADIEDALAAHLGIEPALLGGPDPAVALLVAVGDDALPPRRAPLACVTLPVDGDDRVVVDVLGEPSCQLDDPVLRESLTALALAELRLEADPAGLWSIDAALAAISVATRLGQGEDTDAQAASLARHRSAAAVERLLAIPREVLERADGLRRDELEADLAPLLDWLADAPGGVDIRRWFANWPPELSTLTAGAFGIREMTYAPAGPRRIPVAPSVAAAGLVDDRAKLTLAPGDDDPSYARAELPLRKAAFAAFENARTAWERNAGALSVAADVLEQQRATLVLRAVVPFASTSDGPPRLPEVCVRQFDRDSEAVIDERVLELGTGGALQARVPVLDAGIRVDLVGGSDATAGSRTTIAAALTAPARRRAAAAEELLVLAPEYTDPEAQRSLLLTASILLSAADDEGTGGRRAEVRAGLLARDAVPPANPVPLRTVAAELRELIGYERNEAARDIAGALNAQTFAALDEATRRNRLAKHAPRAALLDALDALLW